MMVVSSERFMDEAAQQPIRVESGNGLYMAEFVDSRMPYAEGGIGPPDQYDNDTERKALLQIVVDQLKPVTLVEQRFTSCTDGRFPLGLESGEQVPVREQLVGSDIVTALFMADALGPRFFDDPDVPIKQRIAEVAERLGSPSTHVPCGAGDNYPAISANVTRLAHNPAFVERNKLFVPEFDSELFDISMLDLAERQQHNELYNGYTPRMIDSAVRAITGPHGVAYLRIDERGEDGHVEEFIVRIQAEDVAIDVAGVATASGDGRQVFGLNDPRLARVAKTMSRTQEDYSVALMAGEAWTNAGHAALGRDLRTAVVRAR